MNTQTIVAMDRCDRCGASSYVLVRLKVGGELYFCAHHARKHRGELMPMTAQWIDQTHLLEEAAATR